MPRLKIRKDDNVEVLSGKDRGKRGRVVHVSPKNDTVTVEGVNRVKRHEKIRMASGTHGGGMEGGIITKEMPIHVSNVGIVCTDCDRPVRVGYEFDTEGKHRVCRRCGKRLGE
jgi:large subunit ribosomal protein L24